MQLNVFDRLVLLNILPKEGNFLTLKIVRSLREDLSFSEDEHKALQFHQDGQIMKWQQSADIPKCIAIGEKANEIIVEALKKLDKENKLQAEHLSIYERFVENGQ
jgi:hypothetical protein